MTQDIRTLARTIVALDTSDGAGVRLRRSIGSQRGLYLDPFLMLDEFSSDHPEDYIAGFPSHPHRGFETVTYMLDGRMAHEDHLGHRGELGPGDVQWMTAGRGIIHSEMPRQNEGRMRGFQLWINLPAAEKMKPAAYREIVSAVIPEVTLPQGGRVRVIAGSYAGASGPIGAGDAPLSTDPMYLDILLPPAGVVEVPVPPGHNAFVYLYEGQAHVGPQATERLLPHRAAGVLSDGGAIRVRAGAEPVRMLLLAARPIGEPVVQYGPFVMNTREEIEQAVRDYNGGNFGR